MSIVIHYFDSWGRAERIRWLLWIFNTEFTERHYEWEEWVALRPTIEFNQLPVVEIDGHTLVQSLVIERYIGHKLAIIPSDPYQAYLVDSVVAYFDDFFRYWADYLVYQTDVDGYVKYYNEELKGNLVWVEKRIEANGNNGFVVGNSLTLADLALANFIIDVFLHGLHKVTLAPLISAGNPKLVKFSENFIKRYPKLVTHIATRPQKEF